MIATETAALIVADNKGETLVLKLTDGTYVGGTAISVNSKGVNLRDTGGRVFTKALSKITVIMTEDQYADEIDPQGDELGVYGDDPEALDIDEAEDGIDDIDYSDEDELDETDEEEDDAEDEGDGMTAAEVAAIFDMPARELRKVTRSMGLGVGRGRTYAFDGDDVTAIRKELKVRATGGIDDATA